MEEAELGTAYVGLDGLEALYGDEARLVNTLLNAVPQDRIKRPMRIVLKSREPFAFAGLWESWRDPAGQVIPSCTIITTGANELLRPVHERMPVILLPDLEEFWLDTDVTDSAAFTDILSPYPDVSMEYYEVSTLVNKAANSVPALTVPAGQGLFG